MSFKFHYNPGWSIPSKCTYFGVYIGCVSLVLMGLIFLYQEYLKPEYTIQDFTSKLDNLRRVGEWDEFGKILEHLRNEKGEIDEYLYNKAILESVTNNLPYNRDLYLERISPTSDYFVEAQRWIVINILNEHKGDFSSSEDEISDVLLKMERMGKVHPMIEFLRAIFLIAKPCNYSNIQLLFEAMKIKYNIVFTDNDIDIPWLKISTECLENKPSVSYITADATDLHYYHAALFVITYQKFKSAYCQNMSLSIIKESLKEFRLAVDKCVFAKRGFNNFNISPRYIKYYIQDSNLRIQELKTFYPSESFDTIIQPKYVQVITHDTLDLFIKHVSLLNNPFIENERKICVAIFLKYNGHILNAENEINDVLLQMENKGKSHPMIELLRALILIYKPCNYSKIQLLFKDYLKKYNIVITDDYISFPVTNTEDLKYYHAALLLISYQNFISAYCQDMPLSTIKESLKEYQVSFKKCVFANRGLDALHIASSNMYNLIQRANIMIKDLKAKYPSESFKTIKITNRFK